MIIRRATINDDHGIQNVYMNAFQESESKLVSKLAIDLLSEKTEPQTISLVAETEDMIVGHIAFSPTPVENNKKFLGYILAPLGIAPNFQKRHIGSKLIESGTHMLSASKVNLIFVYGDPAYYSRFGFSAEEAVHYIPPYKLQYPFGWQALTLSNYDIQESYLSINCVNSLGNPELW